MKNPNENISASQVLTSIKKTENSKANTKKKISFLSAIFIVIGSSIGSGIFFKANSILDNAGYSFPLAIVSWVISALAVIAMSLSLIEITSGKNDNLSMIGWNKAFNNRMVYKFCKNFMFYMYMPLTFFFLPFYAILAFQDSLTGFGVSNNFGTSNDWAIWMIICLAISLWFILTSGLSSKMGNIQNWIITSVKFFPIAIIIILGFVIIGQQGVNVEVKPTGTNNLSFTKLSPGIGMFMSFAAVFFAYDGFYYSAGLQSEMKEPKKTPIALVVGLLIVTTIYLSIAITMSLASSTGSFSGFQEFLNGKGVGWIFGVVNLMICIGVMGIINSFAMWSTRFTEDLLKLGELPMYWKWVGKLNPNKPIVGTVYVLTISVPLIILFSIIGGLAYVASGSYTTNYGIVWYDENGTLLSKFLQDVSIYDVTGLEKLNNVSETIFNQINDKNVTDLGINNIYYAEKQEQLEYVLYCLSHRSQAQTLAFADLMANWTAIGAFAFIVFAIMGGLWNRRTNKIKVQKSKIFIPTAIFSVILVSLGLIFQTLAPFVDLILLVNFESGQLSNDILVGRIMIVVVLLLFVIFMIVPTIFDADSKWLSKYKQPFDIPDSI